MALGNTCLRDVYEGRKVTPSAIKMPLWSFAIQIREPDSYCRLMRVPLESNQASIARVESAHLRQNPRNPGPIFHFQIMMVVVSPG